MNKWVSLIKTGELLLLHSLKCIMFLVQFSELNHDIQPILNNINDETQRATQSH